MMFPLRSNSAFSFLLACSGSDCDDGVTAMSHPNVFNSDDPETVQIFTSIHEEDLFSVCRSNRLLSGADTDIIHPPFVD